VDSYGTLKYYKIKQLSLMCIYIYIYIYIYTCVKKYVHVALAPEVLSKFYVTVTALQFIPSTTSFKGQRMFSKSPRQCSMCMRAHYKQRFLSCYLLLEEKKKISRYAEIPFRTHKNFCPVLYYRLVPKRISNI